MIAGSRRTDWGAIVVNGVLFLVVWLCWGGSWLAISWQQGAVPTQQSIAYRFALASAVLLLALWRSGRLAPVRWRDHGFFLLQGACLYSANFMAFYQATHYITSGMVAVVMSTAILLNAALAYAVWGQRPIAAMRWSAPLGMGGLALVFWPDLAAAEGTARVAAGAALALLGTTCFSVGNMVGIRHARRGIPTLTSNAWGMCYGCLLLVVYNALAGEPWHIDDRPRYIGGLLYLSLAASVLAFPAYLALVERTDASRAATVLVATPVLALALSWAFEGYQWSLAGAVGAALVMLGNAVALAPPGAAEKHSRRVSVTS